MEYNRRDEFRFAYPLNPILLTANHKVAFNREQTTKDEKWDDGKQSWLTWSPTHKEDMAANSAKWTKVELT